MISKLRGLSDDKKRLLGNFFSLSFLQGANYLLPLITLPYLVRVLGVEKFGLIAFAQAFILYFVVITDYGFNLSATREISIHRGNEEKVSKIFSSVLAVKFVLTILSATILFFMVLFIGKFRNDWQIYFMTFGMVIGQTLFPVWFFQGMEKMKYIAFINIVIKGIFIVPIFILVRSPADCIYVPLINSLSFLTSGLLSLWIVFRNFGVRFNWPAVVDIQHQLKEGWHIFVSSIAVSLYTISNTFILGLFTNYTIVGYYSAGEKVVKAFSGLSSPLSQAIYPYISKLASESKKNALFFLRKIIKVVGVLTFLISLMLLMFAPQISKTVLGEQFQKSIPVIQILAFLPFIVSLGNLFAVQGLYAFGFQAIVSRFLVVVAVFHLALVSFLTYLFSSTGTASALLLSECFITCFLFFFFRKYIILNKG